MPRDDTNAATDALVRAILSLGDSDLRTHYVVSVTRAWPIERLAEVLDRLCRRAEQAEPTSREALIAVVDALNTGGVAGEVQRLREQAVGESLLSLERLIRHPARSLGMDPSRSSAPPPGPGAHAAPTKAERGMTLGERKSLARRPDRETMRKLLADPHPHVVQRCLAHPRATEDDVLPLAAKRTAKPDVLTEIARSRWLHRPRIRMALVLNPATPPEIAARLVGLLLRPELERVARAPNVSQGVRALCLDHLARRPPVTLGPTPGSH
jgi:hypothetical protein